VTLSPDLSRQNKKGPFATFPIQARHQIASTYSARQATAAMAGRHFSTFRFSKSQTIEARQDRRKDDLCVSPFSLEYFMKACNTRAKQAYENLLDPDRCDRTQFGTSISVLTILDAIGAFALC